MARYYGNYQGDNGKVYKRIPLNIYRVLVTVGVRGQPDYTNYQEDLTLIPLNYFDYVLPYVPKRGYCEVPFQLRNMLLWTSEFSYLYVPIPWEPNSNQFNEFLTRLKTEFSNKYLTYGLNGEFISGEYLKHSVLHG